MDIYKDRILILDFGSQYTQLIARRIREVGVYCEVHPYDKKIEKIKQFSPKAIVLSGGPESITKKRSPRVSKEIFEIDVPILGICYGMQLIAEMFSGKVEHVSYQEFGYAKLTTKKSYFFKQVNNLKASSEINVWMSHGDQIVNLPNDFILTASTETCAIAGFENKQKKLYGIQFHPEVTHTQYGFEMLKHFIIDISGCETLWKSDNIIEEFVYNIRKQVGDEEVILGLSGGVDSSVVAALLHKAIGNQLICIFVDNGLLRLNEGDQVMEMFSENMGIRVIRCNSGDLFLNNLKGIADPEEKRKIIGHTFIEVFDEQAKRLNGIKFLAQGTIYPDVIESADNVGGSAHVIKSHHNVGGLPDDIQLELIEPLRELFKDEVRSLGIQLGLSYDMVNRHPFPGPGLGVRIIGEIKQNYCATLRKVDAIFIEELHKADWYYKVSQAFAVFLPVKSVGVVGDTRRYAHVVSLRAVETVDFMTAKTVHLPYGLLEKVSRRIINEVKDVSRVTYDISSKPPATIEWE